MIYLTLKFTPWPYSGIPTLKWCRLYVILWWMATGICTCMSQRGCFTGFMPTTTKVMLAASPTIAHHNKLFHGTISAYSSISKRVDFSRKFVYSTSWKCSTWWKFGLHFVYIFIADWNFLTKFCSSNPSFNGNILTFLYLKSETSAHAQLCDYSFIYTI